MEGPEELPGIVRLHLIDFLSGPRLAVVEVDQRCAYSALEEALKVDCGELSSFPRQGRIFDLRRIDTRYEARWRKAE